MTIAFKCFIDNEGVNAKSRLFRAPEILDQYKVNYEQYDQWKVNYLKSPFKKPPQSLLKGKIRYANLIDYFGYTMLNVLDMDGKSPLLRLASKIKQKQNIALKCSQPNEPFIFLPLQVTDDTQLLLNSDISNIDAIRYAQEKAKKNNRHLVIKPHPAETSSDFLQHLNTIVDSRLHIMNAPTHELISKCSSVVTINSTVGLEAIILDKPVEFLGNSLFTHLQSKERLANFILNHLIDIDYFNNREIVSTRKLLQIFDLLEKLEQ